MFQLGIEFVIELDLGSDAPLVGRLVDAVLRSGWVRMEANLVEFRIGLKHAPHIHIGNMLAVSAELVDNFRDPGVILGEDVIHQGIRWNDERIYSFPRRSDLCNNDLRCLWHFFIDTTQ